VAERRERLEGGGEAAERDRDGDKGMPDGDNLFGWSQGTRVHNSITGRTGGEVVSGVIVYLEDGRRYDLEEAGMTEPTIGEIKGRYPALVELVQGDSDLVYRARIELLTLWGIFNKPTESAEMVRLQGIERAVMGHHKDRASAILMWHDFARWPNSFPSPLRVTAHAITDALEAE